MVNPAAVILRVSRGAVSAGQWTRGVVRYHQVLETKPTTEVCSRRLIRVF